MPWWSWLLIWGVLVLGLFVVLIFFAVVLYRNSLGTLRAAEALNDQLLAVERDLPPTVSPFSPAVFADSAVLLHDVELRRADRAHRRQLRRDARIVRGKLLRNAR